MSRGKNLKIHEQTQNKLNFTIQPKLLRFIGLFIGQIGIFSLYTIFIIIPITQLSCERVTQNLQVYSIEQKSSIISLYFYKILNPKYFIVQTQA